MARSATRKGARKRSATKTATSKRSGRAPQARKAAERKRTAGKQKPPARAATSKPGRREASKAATQARIVRAALELFDQKGFQETTTKAIARRAKVAEGTVFNYFETKEDIALHFFELEVDHAIATVRRSTRLRHASLEEKLFALIESQIEYLAPYERFIGAAFVQALRPTSKLMVSARSWALRNRYLAFVQELIDESAAGRPAGALSWIAPQAFWVFYIALLLYWLNDASPGKESTFALLDRALRVGVALLRKEVL
jgi:AcrR family transcriptional regulator